ncbi:Prolyl-tRNA editing protein ProX [bioreactor metagenome]|uniref:Prolyl-tRNA editing protein ProX n=1 Tax=bioreactor metagenome TaxID=1076179 RepID=A0A645A2V5_9ZZZZ|nr:prolyl-tRNA synthetase associated domain-containing protein [Candidatus Metalachnospira sp.]
MEEREKMTYEFLDKLGIKYEKYEHEPVMTIADAQELDKKIGFEICKNLFLSSRHSTEFYLLVMVGSKKFNTGRMSKQIGVPRMTFADDTHMLEYLNIKPGSVSPLGLVNDKGNNVKLLFDYDVLNMEKIAVHPCVNTATLIINTKDFVEKILPACGHDYIKVTVD